MIDWGKDISPVTSAALLHLEHEASRFVNLPGIVGERAGVYLRALEQLAVARRLWLEGVSEHLGAEEEFYSYLPWLRRDDPDLG